VLRLLHLVSLALAESNLIPDEGISIFNKIDIKQVVLLRTVDCAIGFAMPDYKVLTAGDTALVVEFGDFIDRRLSAWVLALARRLSAEPLDGVVETVPTFRSLMVHYDPLVLPTVSLTAHIGELMQGLRITEEVGRRWRLPACYDTCLAPDLDDVAARTGLSPAQVVERHSGVTYHVYMLGFLPGFAYLGDVPAELALPRRETPRVKVPAGSLVIATTLTGIYPLETPSGWHLIGRSPGALWERWPRPQALLAPGDLVSFVPISLREYEDLLAKAADGALKLMPVNETEKTAA
jgi:inhibitor of KinA